MKFLIDPGKVYNYFREDYRRTTKLFNLFLKEGNKINPLIGNSGVSAVPDSARVSQVVGLEYDKTNHLLMHAMGPNVAGVIGSAIAAGVLLSFLG